MLKILGLLIQNLKWIVVGAIVLVGGSVSTKCANDSTWNKKYNAYVKYADSVAGYWVDSLERANTAHLAVAAQQTKKADSLTRRIATLSHVIGDLDSANKALGDSIDKLLDGWVPGQPINPIACEMCLRQRIGLRRQIDSLNSKVIFLEERDETRLATITELNTVVSNRGREVARLDSIITHWPRPQSPPRLFGIFKVTPTQTFFIGAGVGLITAAAVPKL